MNQVTRKQATRRIVVALTALGALGVTTALAKIGSTWLSAAAAGAAAAISIIVGFQITPIIEKRKRKSEYAAKIQEGFHLSTQGKFPLIKSVDDCVRLGVHRSGSSSEPDYVRRDVDDLLDSTTEDAISILIVGDSTSGKTRTAFEFCRRNFRNRKIIAPVDGKSLRWIHASGIKLTDSIIWLDDLEHFIEPDGLNGTILDGLLGGVHKNVILVATIRFVEKSRITEGVKLPDRPRDADARIMRAGRDTLTHHSLKTFEIARPWSKSETKRARSSSFNKRVIAALHFADTMGPPEYLASGPQLLTRWKDGKSVDNAPLGAALVSAAIDIARAGWRKPVDKSSLWELARHYADPRIFDLAPEGALEMALKWATTTINSTTALLLAANSGFVAPDYLIDHTQRTMDKAIPRPLFQFLFEKSDASTALNLAVSAFESDDSLMTMRFLFFASKSPDRRIAGIAASNLGNLYENHRRLKSAIRWWHRSATAGDPIGSTKLGIALKKTDPNRAKCALRQGALEGHPLAGRLLGRQLLEQGQWASAAVVLTHAARTGDIASTRMLGAAHAMLGNLDKARSHWTLAADNRSRDARHNLALLHALQDEKAEAEEIWKSDSSRISLRCLGVLKFRSGEPEAAIQPLQAAATENDWQAAVLLSHVLAHLGRTTEASEWLLISRRMGLASLPAGKQYTSRALSGSWLEVTDGWLGMSAL